MTMAGEHKQIQRNEKQMYIKLCKLSNVVPQECVLNALTLAVEKGELDLSGKTETSSGWEVIAKTVISSTSIKSLILRDCLLPTKGLTAMVTSLCQGSAVTFIDLRGNNIAESGAAQLGKLLRHSTTLESLSLEWNRLGNHLDSFGLFCAGVALAPALKALDLRNNQLTAECASHLASALRQTTALRTVDLRWNCVGFKGGQHLLAAVQENNTICKLRLQGNAVPDELVVAVETVAARNGAHSEAIRLRGEKLRGEAHAQAQRLRDRAEAEAKIRRAEADGAKEVSKLRTALAEKDAALECLRSEASAAELRWRDSEMRLSERLAGEEATRKASEARLEVAGKRLQDREAELREQLVQREAELGAERKLRLAAESHADQLANQIAALERETATHADKMRIARQQQEDAVLAEQAAGRSALAAARREWDAQAESQRSEAQAVLARETQRLQAAQREVEELGTRLGEVSATLAKEQARSEESMALAMKAAREREESRAASLESRLSTARDEIAGLESRLAQAVASAASLHQHNAALLAEISAPQRALVKVNEELTAERQTTQRLRQEVQEEASRTASRLKECEELRARLEKQQLETCQLTKAHTEQLATLARDAELERQHARRDEAARAQALYSALNQYLGCAGKT